MGIQKNRSSSYRRPQSPCRSKKHEVVVVFIIVIIEDASLFAFLPLNDGEARNDGEKKNHHSSAAARRLLLVVEGIAAVPREEGIPHWRKRL